MAHKWVRPLFCSLDCALEWYDQHEGAPFDWREDRRCPIDYYRLRTVPARGPDVDLPWETGPAYGDGGWVPTKMGNLVGSFDLDGLRSIGDDGLVARLAADASALEGKSMHVSTMTAIGQMVVVYCEYDERKR